MMMIRSLKIACLAAVLLCHVGQGATTVPGAAQLEKCFNAHKSSRPVHWKEFYDLHIFQGMVLHKVWWSKHAPSVNVTVVTQASTGRLRNMEELCWSWGGPVSVAIYLPLVQADLGRLSDENAKLVSQAETQLGLLYDRVEEAGACQLQIMLVYEVLLDRLTASLYPVNYLRNYALLQARTDLVFLNDVDNIFSGGVVKQLKKPERWAQVIEACKNKVAFVFPAFETTRGVRGQDRRLHVAHAAASATKKQLVRYNARHMVEQFHAMVTRGHGPTNYTRWFKASVPYEIDFSFGYEPWYMASRLHVPLYDVRLRGYGMNKAVQGYHAARTGFQFYAWPDAWLIHLPHFTTPSQKLFTTKSKVQVGDQGMSLYKKNAKITAGILEDVRGGNYLPVLDKATEFCLQHLDWWNKTEWAKVFAAQPTQERQPAAAPTL